MEIRKIAIAPDSFKESLDAFNVACSIKRGFEKVIPQAEFDLIPMADGGEGTVDAMVHATGGRIVTVEVSDPICRKVEAKFGLLGDGETAVIEMAAASGLPLLEKHLRNPLKTTTIGTGQLIKAALDYNVKRIIIGIGGSATVDGGAGMFCALGGKLLDKSGRLIEPTGSGLADLAFIDIDGFDKRIYQTEILVACDVDNPLIGPKGAAYIFARQKGADDEMIEILEKNLIHFANCIRDQLGVDVASKPGAGAAGGLGAALLAFCNAKLESGSKIVGQAVNLSERIKSADLCITGEGKIDHQSIYGKVAYYVATVAKQSNKPVIAIAGTIGEDAHKCIPLIDAIFSIINKPMPLDYAINNAEQLITSVSEQIARLLTIK